MPATICARPGSRLVGIDYFSVDPKGDKSRSAHLPLLSSGIIILEAVQLTAWFQATMSCGACP